jgi:hypothetical protein
MYSSCCRNNGASKQKSELTRKIIPATDTTEQQIALPGLTNVFIFLETPSVACHQESIGTKIGGEATTQKRLDHMTTRGVAKWHLLFNPALGLFLVVDCLKFNISTTWFHIGGKVYNNKKRLFNEHGRSHLQEGDSTTSSLYVFVQYRLGKRN